MAKREFEDITIIADTREQEPLLFTRCSAEVGTLPTGDYSVKGLEQHICIERKSLPDLVASTCSQQRGRFEAELLRAKAYRWAYLVIEATVGQVYDGGYRSRACPESVIGSVVAFSVRYGVMPIFAGNAEQAAKIVEHIALMCVRRLEEDAEALGFKREEHGKD
jgi:ERCC4-type nuclease